MGNSLLLLFQRNHILHKSYLFVEITYIYLFPVQEFIQRTELGCGELTRKQVEKRGRVELDILADVGYRLFYDKVVVESQCLDIRQGNPICHILVQAAVERTVYLYERKISDGHDALYFGLHGTFQPMHVSGVFGAVLGAERLELHQVYVLKSRQFIQNPLGGFVQIFVHINQTAGQLHIMEDFTLFFSGTFNQQDFQLLSVKTNHHTTIEFPRSYVADVQAIQFVEIKPKVEGFVQKIYVDEGQKVKKGQPLFQLSSDQYSETVKEAQANYKQAQAQYEMANYEAERIGRLVDKQILSKIRLDQANKEKEVAQMKVEQAKAQMQRSQMDYSYTTITAPFDGYIDRIPYKTGSLVNPQSLLTTVSDISEIFAYYKVNESEYLEYKRQQLSGQKQHEENNVELILSDGSIYSHKGTLETVEGDFERGTGSIAFRVRFPNPDGLLKHGVTGKVRMMTQMDNICLVPQKSTFEIQDFTYVYTVDSASVVKVRSFQPLERYNNYYVTQDFSPNTAIVYEGVQMMKDGITIKTDTIDMEAIRKEVELKQPIVK